MDETVSAALKAARDKLQARDPASAAQALKTVIASGQTNGEVFEMLGVAHGMMGNATAARAAFAEATRLEPGRASAHFNYAVLLFRDGELDIALEEASAAVYIDPNYAGASQLQKQIAQKIRDRKLIGDEAFKTVGRSPSQEAIRCGTLGQLICPVCGRNNLFSARVCRHCGTLIKEMPDVIPVE